MYSSNPPHPTLKKDHARDFHLSRSELTFLWQTSTKRNTHSVTKLGGLFVSLLLDKIDFSLANPYEKKHRPTLSK